MAKLFIEDCRCMLPTSTLDDGTDADGEVLLRVTREDGTEIAKLVQSYETSSDKTKFKSRLRWLVPSSVTLTDEERSNLIDFMEAGKARLRETLKDLKARWKRATEQAKSEMAAIDILVEEFVDDRLIGKPSTRKRKTKKSTNKRAKS